MRGLILETRRRRIENNHLVILLDHSLNVLLELLLVLKHHLALHDVVLCIGSHGLQVIAVFLIHLLASLQVIWLLDSAKGSCYFAGSQNTKTHGIVFASNCAHVR